MMKFAMPCTKSHGIPAIHHATAPAKPLVKIYGIAHRNPNKRPNIPDTKLQSHAVFIFLKSKTTAANNGHAYRYIIHQMPKP